MMKLSNKITIQQRWQKAALLGSVWASIEIVIGSFLHNMKFPLTGTILSALGIVLLVAGHSLWNEKGIIWRAGIICAVMKSISPSSVILGPMIGITAEAFLMEFAIRFIGGNPLGYIIGGAIACTTPLIQKTISFLFVYGMDLATVFVRLVEFAAKYLNVPSLNSQDVIIVVICINFLFGGLSALVGMIVGKRAVLNSDLHFHHYKPGENNSTGEPSSESRFSIPLLLIHLVILAIGLFTMTAYFLLYIPFCIYRYPQIRKRFLKIRFWLEIAVVSIFAGIIIGTFSLHNSTEGLLIGLQMFSRALFVLTIFSGLAIELRNPRVIQLLFGSRLQNLRWSLETAFEALPTFIDSLQQEKGFLKHPIESLARMFSLTNRLLINHNGISNVIILTGEKDSGKTHLIHELVKQLQLKKMNVAGIIQNKVFKDGERIGYDLFDIQSTQTIPLCRLDGKDEGIVAGPFKFSLEAIRFGNDALSIEKLQKNEIVIIDEVGPLEMKDGGWAKALSILLKHHSGNIVIVVRESLVEQLIEKYQFQPTLIWDIEKIKVEHAVHYLLHHS